jgi:hypothetical protein
VAVVDLLLSAVDTRKWHVLLFERLANSGHDVQVVSRTLAPTERGLDSVLKLECLYARSARSSLATRVTPFGQSAASRRPDLTIDLTAGDDLAHSSAPRLTVSFSGGRRLTTAASVLCRGEVPVVDLYLDGVRIDHAEPMADSRVVVAHGLTDVLARAITLIARFMDRFDTGVWRVASTATRPAPPPDPERVRHLLYEHLLGTVPRLMKRAVRRMYSYPGHWRVGYRFVTGPGVAETRSLGGAPWAVLADDGHRFYADPFPLQHQGRYFMFVEELVHGEAKGVISVSECDAAGRFERPYQVLQEPFHLSYPQVFVHGGEVLMMPEAAAGRRLALYRAQSFPDRWTEVAVLISGREIFDATLLEHDGLFWILATERDGLGSASDTMVAYYARSITGPWTSHARNPLLIDKAAARPGGAATRVGDQMLLPVQDGTTCYGGGLGLSTILQLNPDEVVLSAPVPIDTKGHWPYPQIHTLNRSGPLETVDGIANSMRISFPTY